LLVTIVIVLETGLTSSAPSVFSKRVFLNFSHKSKVLFT
jgi:hypothetical protein